MSEELHRERDDALADQFLIEDSLRLFSCDNAPLTLLQGPKYKNAHEVNKEVIELIDKMDSNNLTRSTNLIALNRQRALEYHRIQEKFRCASSTSPMDSSLIEERDNDSFVQLHAAHPSISSQHSSKLTPPQFTLSDGKSIGMQILPAARVRKEMRHLITPNSSLKEATDPIHMQESMLHSLSSGSGSRWNLCKHKESGGTVIVSVSTETPVTPYVVTLRSAVTGNIMLGKAKSLPQHLSSSVATPADSASVDPTSWLFGGSSDGDCNNEEYGDESCTRDTISMRIYSDADRSTRNSIVRKSVSNKPRMNPRKPKKVTKYIVGKPVAYSMPAYIIPVIKPLADSITWLYSKYSRRVEDQPLLKYQPYFGDNDISGVDISAYDTANNQFTREITSEVLELCIVLLLDKYSTSCTRDLSGDMLHDIAVVLPPEDHLVVQQLLQYLGVTYDHIVETYQKCKYLNENNRSTEQRLNRHKVVKQYGHLSTARLASAIDCEAPRTMQKQTMYSNQMGIIRPSLLPAGAAPLIGGNANPTDACVAEADLNSDMVKAGWLNMVERFKDLVCMRCCNFDCATHGCEQPKKRVHENRKTGFDTVGGLRIPNRSVDIMNNALARREPAVRMDMYRSWLSSSTEQKESVSCSTPSSSSKSNTSNKKRKLPINMPVTATGRAARQMESLPWDSVEICLLHKLVEMYNPYEVPAHDVGVGIESEDVITNASGEPMSLRAIVVIAQLLGTRTSQEVSDYLYSVTVPIEESKSAAKKFFSSKAGVMKGKGYPSTVSLQSLTSSTEEKSIFRPTSVDNMSGGVNWAKKGASRVDYVPCNHPGPCDRTCPCLLEGTGSGFCEKYCACSSSCKHRFAGCACRRSQCRTKACPCFAASRECDPDLCGMCGAAVHPDDYEGVKAALENLEYCQPCSSTTTTNDNGNAGIRMCRNVAVSHLQSKMVVKGFSSTHGWGAFIQEPAEKNDYIMEYVGEIITQNEADRRGHIYDKNLCSFVFNLNNELTIDATKRGNVSKFANHSSMPNVYVRIVTVNGDHRICFMAKEKLAAGDELFFNYGYDPNVVHSSGSNGSSNSGSATQKSANQKSRGSVIDVL